MPKSALRLSKAAALGLLAGLAACQVPAERRHLPEPAGQAKSEILLASELPDSAMSLDEQLAFAIKDLAERLGSEQDSIQFLFARRVTWRTGALGCPKPGMSYTQALVPGVWIMLESGDDEYAYHATKGGKPFHCPASRTERPAWIEREDLA